MSNNNKYSRHQSIISRNADESIDEDHWLSQLQKNLQKGAVQSKPAESIYDQINSIMNGKSKYPSVDAAVEDMKKRSGLTDYLNKNSGATQNNNAKTASTDDNNVIDKKTPVEKVVVISPVVIKKHPSIAKTIENIVESGRGNLSLPSVLDRIMSIHKSDISDAKDWEDPDLLKYISDKVLTEKQKHIDSTDENSLGRADTSMSDDFDQSNTDAFFSLTPAKI